MSIMIVPVYKCAPALMKKACHWDSGKPETFKIRCVPAGTHSAGEAKIAAAAYLYQVDCDGEGIDLLLSY